MTLRWDDFTPVQNEELVGYEIGVFDQEGVQFNNTWHQVSVILDTVNTVSVYPTGWIMPSFLYDANEERIVSQQSRSHSKMEFNLLLSGLRFCVPFIWMQMSGELRSC